jgi:hypothetical protein
MGGGIAIDGAERGAGRYPGVEAGRWGRLLCGFIGLPSIDELVVDGDDLLLIGRGEGVVRVQQLLGGDGLPGCPESAIRA